MLAIAVLVISLIFLLVASIFDIKTTEIPDNVSVGFIVFILFLSIVHSVYSSDYSHFLNTFIVGLAYAAVGLLLFYLGQWGGGDVKVFGGIGCVLGYLNSMNYAWVNSRILPYYLVYFINLGLVAIPCLLLYTLVVGFRNRKLFTEFLAQARTKMFILLLILSFMPSAVAVYLGMGSLALIYLMLPVFTVLSVYLKVSERVLFRKKSRVEDLKIGDVLAEDIIVEGVKLASKSNMEGLDEEQLSQLKKLSAEGRLAGEVTVKLGVVFVPIYLIAFLVTSWIGNPIEILLRTL